MRRTCIVLIAFLAPAAAGAQKTTELTEEAFLAAVGAEHPAAAALAAERDLAAAEAVRAALLPNPMLEAAVEEPDGAARETTAGVTWTPPLDGRRALRRQAAELGLAAAEGRLNAAWLRLRLDLKAAYAAWAIAGARRDLLAEHLERVAELAERARARAVAGEIPGLAARRLTLEEAQAQADLGRAEARLATARAAIAAWHQALPAGARPAPPPLPPLPPLSSPVVAPDLAAREREVERAEALRRLSAKVVEAPALGLGWKRIEEAGADAAGPVVSVGWTLPLFDRRQADRQEAEARLTAARAELALARARATAELAGASAAAERLRAEAEAAECAAAGIEVLLGGATAAYQAGESGLTDVLDTLRAALAARLSALEVREAALAAQRDLEAAAGRPLTGDLP